LLGRITTEDVRSRSVAALAERYHVDRAQAIRVGTTALQLLDQAAGAWRLEGPEYRNLLSWAADLHEVGMDIAHRHYHKHGEYVVAESELLGFTREEQWLLSALIRAHRRKFPAAVVKELPRRRGREVERLGILLRLAVVLHRSRNPDPLPKLRFDAAKKTVRLVFPEGWLDGKPLTRADLEQERGYLKAIGVALEFR
jgi:exopolyphosphatase/guanosine-5'-triphosphate,3'-diphosphate pyrophosphatase